MTTSNKPPIHLDYTKSTNLNGAPAVALLMTYPNSGTSYTMMTVQQISNRTVATNYPKEAGSYDRIVQRLYPDYDVPVLLRRDMHSPSKYILTKTHCSGFNFEGSPLNKLKSFDSFDTGCFSCNNHKGTVYPFHLAKKVIHIVRDPVDNIISNFNLFQSRDVIHSKDEWNEMTNIVGSVNIFKSFCHKYDQRWYRTTSRAFKDAFHLIKEVPCGSMYVIYAIWHNHAYHLAEDLLKIPILHIHYSDYEENFDGTIDKIMRFLELDPVNLPKPFISGKKYTSYLTPKERADIFKIIKHFASPKVWELIKKYQHV